MIFYLTSLNLQSFGNALPLYPEDSVLLTQVLRQVYVPNVCVDVEIVVDDVILSRWYDPFWLFVLGPRRIPAHHVHIFFLHFLLLFELVQHLLIIKNANN